MTAPKMLYHAPYELGPLNSGSRVRPYYMLQSFKQLGYDVTIISGAVAQRKEQIKALTGSRLDQFQFCYSEPSTYPVHPVWDYRFYWELRRAGIPLGIFYRDALWKLAPEWMRQNYGRRKALHMRYLADLQIYNRTAKILFFPSQMFADEINVSVEKRVLWPGGRTLPDAELERPSLCDPYTVTYVGTMNRYYGAGLLLEAMRLVNRWRFVKLNIVCPRTDVEDHPSLFAEYRDAPWLKIHHLSGDELTAIYRDGHLAVISNLRNHYNDLRMPIKLFEYMSYGLPQVVTNCTEMASFVNDSGVGLVAEDNAPALAGQIQRMLSDQYLYAKTAAAVRQTLVNGHRWQDRAKTVVDALGTHQQQGVRQ